MEYEYSYEEYSPENNFIVNSDARMVIAIWTEHI